jgi:hypothetical protein
MHLALTKVAAAGSDTRPRSLFSARRITRLGTALGAAAGEELVVGLGGQLEKSLGVAVSEPVGGVPGGF